MPCAYEEPYAHQERRRFTEPMNVTQQKGAYNYTLTDGKTRDASHLYVVAETFTLPAEDVGPTEPATYDE